MKNSIKHKIQWIVLFICLIGFLVLVENVFNKEIIKGDIIGYNIISNLLISSTVTPVARGITFCRFVKHMSHFIDKYSS